LASTAGFAAAEVAVTGTARMGVVTGQTFDGIDDAYTGASGAQFSSRVRIIFTASGETDNGLTFGASVRNDQDGVGNTANGNSTVYISGAFGKLTMGDTGNAADSLVGQVSGVGYTSLGSMNEISWLDKTPTGAQYEYSAGALTFAVGAGQLDLGEDFVSAAVKYSTDAYGVALGYESNNVESQISASGSATFSGVTVKAKVAKADSNTFDYDTEYALSADYTMGSVGLTAFYTEAYGFDSEDIYDMLGRVGVGASYDLGGGASVVGGVAKVDSYDAVYDLGVKMSF
jgi:outer membrane protein OmpU